MIMQTHKKQDSDSHLLWKCKRHIMQEEEKSTLEPLKA